MKRIKFMLMSLALIAVVGGALAFKAKYTQTFCTTLAVQNAAGVSTCIIPASGITLSCPNKVENVKKGPNSNRIYCTTTPANVQGVGLTCFVGNDPSLTLTCLSTTTSTVINP